MSEAESIRVGALVSVLVLLVPGFLLHEAPRFPGSLLGGALGIAGAVLMVLLLVYSLARRSAAVKGLLSRHVSMRALMAFHVYAGVVGALLGLIHSGHAFRSPLGVGLVATMLTVVLSGFVGHYHLARLGTELRDDESGLATLQARYAMVSREIRASPPGEAVIDPSGPGVIGRTPGAPLGQLLEAIAEVEHAINARERLKRAVSKWTVLHVASALVMYSLLTLHVWNGIYFGLRWLR